MLRMQERKIGRVIVVEDDMILATVHTHLVRQIFKCEPEVFSRAEDAIDFVDSEKDNNEYKLILLDLNMPGMSGWDFLDNISKRNYADKILVVIVTSSLFWEDYNRSKNYSQVIAYFTKPLKKEKFRELINRKNIVIKSIKI